MNSLKLIIIIPIVIIGIIALTFFEPTSHDQSYHYSEVMKRDINLTLHLRGTLEASKFVQITSPILSNRAKIVFLIQEGSKVEQGDVIARFDTKPFEDEKNRWHQKDKEANASYIKANKELEIQISKNRQNSEKAKATIEIDKLKYQDIQQGDGLIRFNELHQGINQASREVALAQTDTQDYAFLLKKGYISQREYSQVSDTLEVAKEKLSSQREKLVHYINYEWPRQIKEQEIRIHEHEINLLSIQEQNILNIENKRAQKMKAQSHLHHAQRELEKAKTNLKNCVVKAPISGVVLYNKLQKNGRKVKVAIGDSIWLNQSFLQIPDTKTMVVKTSIREADLLRIHHGDKARITLDHDLSSFYDAKVIYIGTISTADDNGINTFELILELQSKSLLHSGISATATIVYKSIADAVSIPSSAIFEDHGQTYVLVKESNDLLKRSVEVGAISSAYAHVLSGLSLGDIVASR